MFRRCPVERHRPTEPAPPRRVLTQSYSAALIWSGMRQRPLHMKGLALNLKPLAYALAVAGVAVAGTSGAISLDPSTWLAKDG